MSIKVTGCIDCPFSIADNLLELPTWCAAKNIKSEDMPNYKGYGAKEDNCKISSKCPLLLKPIMICLDKSINRKGE